MKVLCHHDSACQQASWPAKLLLATGQVADLEHPAPGAAWGHPRVPGLHDLPVWHDNGTVACMSAV